MVAELWDDGDEVEKCGSMISLGNILHINKILKNKDTLAVYVFSAIFRIVWIGDCFSTSVIDSVPGVEMTVKFLAITSSAVSTGSS